MGSPMSDRRDPWPRFARPLGFVRARFSPEGYLGLHLTVGLLVILIAAWCFADIAEDISRDAATRLLDERVIAWFHGLATPAFTQCARVFSFFGSVVFLVAGSSALAAALCWKRAWDQLLLLAVTMLGGSLLNILLKHLFHRHRPVLENPLVTLTSFGFPSGHTMGATLFYGLIALYAGHLAKQRIWRVLTFLSAALFIAAVGLSRIYLGAHYPTDVLGAIAAASVWLGFCWTGSETMRRRHEWLRARYRN